MSVISTAAIFFGAVVTKVSAHSWVHCTDYQVDDANVQIEARTNPLDGALPERVIYDAGRCNGYPPSFPTFVDSSVIGVDAGYNVQVNIDGGQICPPNRANNYSDQFPVATYEAGEFVCVAHPTKNHVADSETNINIPDTSMEIWYTPQQQVLGATFPGTGDFEEIEHLNGVHVNGQEDYLGFQNCPNFLNNNDRSLCTLCFQIPEELTTGVYSWAWIWQFNNGDSPYSTCWNANVVANGDATPTTTTTMATTATTTQTTVTEPVETVAGECESDGILACTRGLRGRGTCIPTDDGFVCDCEPGFEVAGTDQVCSFTEAVMIRLTFGVSFDDIQDEAILIEFLETEIAVGILGLDDNSRVTIAGLEADANNQLVAIIQISGQNEQNDASGVSMATTLSDFLSDEDSVHNFGGFMANAVDVECLNCAEVVANTGVEDSSASTVVPSLFGLASITATLMMH